MNIWILTIGNSDVQLKPKHNWTNLYRAGRSQLKPDRGFSPFKLPDSDRFRVPSRVMGVIYSQPQASLDDLDFPLIDNFINKLKAQQVAIDKVLLVLSDQSVFSETKRTQRHPYWQDTCTLQPILENYLADQWKDVSPNLEIKPLLLEATSEEEGLDNWDAVLTLAQQKFASPDLDFPKDTTVYVSHQASTPAISSAVQFCSLAKFGDRVKFLVSNEYNPTFPEKPLEGSSYLRGIRIQEAKALLGEGSYNYAGVEALLEDYIQENEDIKTLLNAAKNWNVAKFSDFLDCLKQYPKFGSEVAERTREENWWWIAYEESYLAVIRKKQDNIVEALFHSFRAVEGLICEWAIAKYQSYVYYDKKGAPQIREKIQEVLPTYWEKVATKNQVWLSNLAEQNRNREAKGKLPEPIGVGLFSQNLYLLLEEVKPESKKDPFLKKGLYNAKDTRNQQFHRLLGLREKDLTNAWGVDSIAEWEETVVGCLNAIANDDLPRDVSFQFPKEASLMVKVHQALKNAIDDL